jgi:D-serine deaminase-like pyridoxal phosphate-dependent protein
VSRDPRPASIDVQRVADLADEPLGWRFKAVPPQFWGATVAEMLASAPRLSDLPTPLLTLAAPALTANVATMASWVDERGLDLAPHGKTTMAPALWAKQLQAGACGITVATPAQLAVARAFGVTRVMLANEVVSRSPLAWIADELAVDPWLEITVWVDSVRGVRLMDEALSEHARTHPGTELGRLGVLVERGAPGGRAGARDEAAALEVADAVARSRALRLVGVAGYEGAIAHTTDGASLDIVRGYLREVAALHLRIEAQGLYPRDAEPVVTAGGSAYFDLVADELGPLTGTGARVVLRSGAYLTHDDGFYRRISPLGRDRRTTGPLLTAALHAWVSVLSHPEHGLALVDGGKRDLPYDEGLPESQVRCPRVAGERGARLEDVSVSALNDQHGFLRLPSDRPDQLQVGDRLRLGLSHPCTAFDKWALIPVVDDPDGDDPLVVDLVRTFF